MPETERALSFIEMLALELAEIKKRDALLAATGRLEAESEHGRQTAQASAEDRVEETGGIPTPLRERTGN